MATRTRRKPDAPGRTAVADRDPALLRRIHEVMVLDHSGPLFGLILYGAAVKLFVLSAVVLLATNPFAIRYATEARMYSLVVVLVLLNAVFSGLSE